jgi:pyruvate dehydrogenase E1 component alpha subunit
MTDRVTKATAIEGNGAVPRRTTAAAETAPDAAPAARVELLRTMVRIRRFEEHCVQLYSAEKIRGFLHLYIGEEAVAAGVFSEIGPRDAVVSTYREHGHALARGIPMTALMAEMYGRTTGCSHGRGGSMHLFDAGRRFYGGNAIVGGGLPLAARFVYSERSS